YLGDTVLELSAGIGNLAGRLMSRRLLYVAAEKEALHLHALRNRFLRSPNVRIRRIDPEQPADFDDRDGSFDTILCLNVLEYLDHPRIAIESGRSLLNPGGTLVVVAPQSVSLFGAVDKAMGHKRRFERKELEQLLASSGLEVERVFSLNKASAPAWWIYSRLFLSKRIDKLSLKVFDKTVWLWRRIDPILPWPGVAIVLVARNPAAAKPAPSVERLAVPAATAGSRRETP